MKKTFTTTMPDREGAFLKANECITALGLNITRVSYNKAVDAHMLFLEVEGEDSLLAEAERKLEAIGYLRSNQTPGSVLLLEFRMADKPGSLQPVVRLIDRYGFNISYISSRENGSGYQDFKMGLFVTAEGEVSRFLEEAALLCPVRILDYDKSEKVLDNTVFYLNFSAEISEKMGFGEEEQARLMVHSNRILQNLDEQNAPAYKTFDYIRRFAEHLCRYRGEAFAPRITREGQLTLIEPPCGSNLCLLEAEGMLLCIDSGFACYRTEQEALLRRLYPDFDKRKKVLLLTHPDVDHCGCIDLFDEVYLSDRCHEAFERERAGEAATREENPLHEPYVALAKLLTSYCPPLEKAMHRLGKGSGTRLLEQIGVLELGPYRFEVYEGSGGHVQGETVFVERRQRWIFSGDIFVNIKDFTPEQAQFNKLAPYLMTSVDTDPRQARREREALFRLADPGPWRLVGGHGGFYDMMIE